MDKNELLKKVRVVLKSNYFKSSKTNLVRVSGQFELRVKLGKKTYMPSISLEYRFLWTGDRIQDIDPEAEMHLIAGFGEPAGRWREALSILDPTSDLSDEVRLDRFESILQDELDQWSQVGASPESFLIAYRSAMSVPGRPYLAYGPAWLPRQKQN